MLNKEICKKCSKKHWDIAPAWGDGDEARWKSGIIMCPDIFMEASEDNEQRVKSAPPKYCPYKLEHMLC